MEDETDGEEARSKDEGEKESAELSTGTLDSDEMNLFVLDMYDQFNFDSENATTELERNQQESPNESSIEHANMDKFIAMMKSSEKVPQMLKEMSNDELRRMVEEGLQSQKFVPIIPNPHAGPSSGRGALSSVPYPLKPKLKKGSYRSWKESTSLTGRSGHHDAFSRTVWKTASRNQKDTIVPFEEKSVAVSSQVEASLQFVYEDEPSDAEVTNPAIQGTKEKIGDKYEEDSPSAEKTGRPKEDDN